MEDTNQSEIYDFGINPIIVNTVLANFPQPNQISHKLRKPTIAEWLLWGFEIYEERRYATQAELNEINENKDEDDIDAEIAYEKIYNEFSASFSLYELIAEEVIVYKADENEELVEDKRYNLTPELLNKAILNKDSVIGRLYRSYCEKENFTDNADSDEILVKQTFRSDEYLPVLHFLRKPTNEEKIQFIERTHRLYWKDTKQQEVRFCLNLRNVIEIYDSLIIRIENAKATDNLFNQDFRQDFLKEINPIYKLKILESALEHRLWEFSHD